MTPRPSAEGDLIQRRRTSVLAPTTATAWKTIPSWYLLGTEDRTITPAAQRLMAERAGATIEEVEASHMSLISRPGEAAELIEEAAAATSRPE
jgi:pimeloyl-ACP methyl ester carboxylesterase